MLPVPLCLMKLTPVTLTEPDDGSTLPCRSSEYQPLAVVEDVAGGINDTGVILERDSQRVAVTASRVTFIVIVESNGTVAAQTGVAAKSHIAQEKATRQEIS